MNVTVDEEDLAKAIGRRGQNARLTSKLTGWDVQVRKDESQHEQFEARVGDAASHLAESLGLVPLLADKLFRAGGVTIDMVTQMPVEYIAGALEVDLEEAHRILAASKGEDPAAPAEEVSASEGVPTEEAPTEEAPTEEAPGEEAPGEEAPGEEAPEAEETTEG